jgi:hypothetical protein
MIAKSILVALIVMTAQAQAADRAGPGAGDRAFAARRLDAKGPYPLSWRAAKIRRADRCWRGCLAAAGREFQRCLRFEPATGCVPWNDANDRACLRACRLSGGPLLPAYD